MLDLYLYDVLQNFKVCLIFLTAVLGVISTFFLIHLTEQEWRNKSINSLKENSKVDQKLRKPTQPRQ